MTCEKDLTILSEKKPEVAKFLKNWCNQNERKFNFSDEKEQANFYEAIAELAKHLSFNGESAFLSTVVNSEGIQTVNISIISKKE